MRTTSRIRWFGIWMLVLFVLPSSTVLAQAYARVAFTVEGPDGKPVEGVKIVATCNDLPNYRVERSSNKKGKAVFQFTDSTKVYQFLIQAEGYPPQNFPMKPQTRQTMNRTITLNELQTGGGGGTRLVFTPAEKAFNEGVLALREGEKETARTSFMKALELNPEMAIAHSAMSGIYLEDKNYDAAIAAAKKSLELDPGKPRGYRLLYEAYRGQGNQKEADEARKALAELDDGDTSVMTYNEGVEAFKVGDYGRAKTLFQEALQIQPDMQPAVSALMQIHLVEKEYEQAAAMSEKMLEMKPGDVKALQVRYDAYRLLGNQERMEAAFQELAAADPEFLETALYESGSKFFDNNEIDAALEQLAKVIQINPDNALAHYRIGLCHVNKAAIDKAKEHLQRFIELAPDHPEAPVAKDMLNAL